MSRVESTEMRRGDRLSPRKRAPAQTAAANTASIGTRARVTKRTDYTVFRSGCLHLFRHDVRLAVLPGQHLVCFGIALHRPGLFIPVESAAETIRNIGQMHQVARERALFDL